MQNPNPNPRPPPLRRREKLPVIRPPINPPEPNNAPPPINRPEPHHAPPRATQVAIIQSPPPLAAVIHPDPSISKPALVPRATHLAIIRPLKTCIPDLNFSLPESSSSSETSSEPAIPFPDDSTPEEQMFAEVARSRNWEEWALNSVLPGIQIPNDPSYLCYLHGILIRSKIMPVENIRAQLPCSITENKRFNSLGGYVLYCVRELDGGRAIRKVVNVNNPDVKWNVKWKVKDAARLISGKFGRMGGSCTGLVLMYSRDHRSEWNALECVSANCERGDSCVIFLSRKNDQWINLEQEVKEADNQLDDLHQKCFDARHQKKSVVRAVKEAEVAVFKAEATLGEAITKFDEKRTVFKDEEVRLTTPAVDEDVSVALSRGSAPHIDEDGSDGAVRASRPSYIMKLKDKKMKGKMQV